MERNRGGRPRHPDVLTPAEWRVLDALREGGTNAEIAARLGISPDAVKYHISNMLGKLSLQGRHELAAWRPDVERRRLGAVFAVPAALAYVVRPLVWAGLGTAAAAGVVVAVAAAVAVVAVVLVGLPGSGEPSAVVRPPAAPPVTTSTPPPTPTDAPAAAATSAPTATPTPSPSPTPVPGPTATPSPTPEPGGPLMRYDRFDPTGEASTPGSYAFLMPDGETTRVVETYEELRTESTVLRVNVTDSNDESQVTFYNAVAVGDDVEWRTAARCWVRMLITDQLTGTATVKDFAVEPYSYSYGGCSGTVPGALTTEFRWRPPNLSTPNITVPFLHGPVFVWPKEWAGSRPSNARMTPAAITWPPSPLPDPDLGDEWTGSVAEGYGGLEGYYSHRDHGLSLDVYIGRVRTTPDMLHLVDTSDEEWATEYLLIDGKPAYVTWHLVPEFWSSAALVIYDVEHDIAYSFEGLNLLRDDPEGLIEIARKFLIYRR